MMRPSSILFSMLLLAIPLATGCQNGDPKSDGLKDGTWVDLIAQGPEAFVKNGGVAEYEFKDGVLIGKTRPKTQNTFLCTKKRYRDFEMTFEFHVDPKLNSGLQFRSNIKILKNGKERVWGYQCEIDPSERSYSAGIYEEAGRGWLADLKDNEKARNALKQGEWNQVRILAVGDLIKTWINGVPAADLLDERTQEGFFGFQVHAVPYADEVLVQWRNARVREIGAQ
jgi:3-keto-disaccharide hydrolase